MALNRHKDLKLYHSIGEVAQMLGESETTLRYWEKQFPSIKPHKAGRGIRQYSKQDIEELKKLHHLLREKGMTMDGARQALQQGKHVSTTRLEVLERLKAIRDELQEIGQSLNGVV